MEQKNDPNSTQAALLALLEYHRKDFLERLERHQGDQSKLRQQISEIERTQERLNRVVFEGEPNNDSTPHYAEMIRLKQNVNSILKQFEGRSDDKKQKGMIRFGERLSLRRELVLVVITAIVTILCTELYDYFKSDTDEKPNQEDSRPHGEDMPGDISLFQDVE